MAYTVKRYTFKDGKVMFEDRIAYANGEYVSFDDYEIAMQKKHEKIEGLRKELRESKDYITQLKHELEEKCSFETDRLVKLPFDALETANMLINATYSRKTSNVEKAFIGCNVVKGDIYSIDELEQIAEHLLVYCKHNKEE
nr:MAG TPA: hypothetical protein [Caudoviricetes sp.]